MLKLSMQTDPGEYRLPDSPLWTHSLRYLAEYNLDLLDPPRIYSESATGLLGVFSAAVATANSDNVISLATENRCVFYPSYSWSTWHFDAQTGEIVGFVPVTPGYLTSDMFAGRDDSLYVQTDYNNCYEVDPATLEQIPGTNIVAADFGIGGIYQPMWDKAADRILLRTTVNEISIFRLSDKTLIQKMTFCDVVSRIFPADERRAYVRMESNVFILIDYMDFRVLGIVRIPGVTSGNTKVSWDWRRQRFLVAHLTPDAEDGACTLCIQCYYPTPVATNLVKPIPLASPRKGRTVPFWTRAIGDVGEGVGGRPVAVTVTGGTLQSGLIQTGSDGAARFNVLCDEPGSLTVDCAVEVL